MANKKSQMQGVVDEMLDSWRRGVEIKRNALAERMKQDSTEVKDSIYDVIQDAVQKAKGNVLERHGIMRQAMDAALSELHAEKEALVRTRQDAEVRLFEISEITSGIQSLYRALYGEPTTTSTVTPSTTTNLPAARATQREKPYPVYDSGKKRGKKRVQQRHDRTSGNEHERTKLREQAILRAYEMGKIGATFTMKDIVNQTDIGKAIGKKPYVALYVTLNYSDKFTNLGNGRFRVKAADAG